MPLQSLRRAKPTQYHKSSAHGWGQFHSEKGLGLCAGRKVRNQAQENWGVYSTNTPEPGQRAACKGSTATSEQLCSLAVSIFQDVRACAEEENPNQAFMAAKSVLQSPAGFKSCENWDNCTLTHRAILIWMLAS